MLRHSALACAALVSLALPVRALTLPDRPIGRVSDFAGALDPAARQRVEETLASSSPGASHQIGVALFRSLEGGAIEDVSIRLAEKWKIGSRADDGVLITVFTDDRQLRIEVGYGLEERLPDAACARIIRDVMVPHIRSGDLEGGLRAGVVAVETAIAGRTTGDAAVTERDRPARDGWSWDDLLGFVVVPALFLLFFLLRRGPFFGGLFGGRRGSSTGGGFSGGGGSFGGGGASGKW